MAEPQRKLPISAKLQMEDLPTEMLAGGTLLTECCQGKGPLVGLLLPFLTGENQNTLKAGEALKGQALMEGPDGRSLMKCLREVLILGWWLAIDSWHIDFQCNTTAH